MDLSKSKLFSIDSLLSTTAKSNGTPSHTADSVQRQHYKNVIVPQQQQQQQQQNTSVDQAPNAMGGWKTYLCKNKKNRRAQRRPRIPSTMRNYEIDAKYGRVKKVAKKITKKLQNRKKNRKKCFKKVVRKYRKKSYRSVPVNPYLAWQTGYRPPSFWW